MAEVCQVVVAVAQTLQVVLLGFLVVIAVLILVAILLWDLITRVVLCIVSQLIHVMLYRVVETDGMGVVLVILTGVCYMEEVAVARIPTQLMSVLVNRLGALVGVQPAVQVKVAAYQSYRCSYLFLSGIAALA